MDAQALYQQLERDFIAGCRDDWSRMPVHEYISENFRRRYMGVMLDNAAEIRTVRTAVFASDRVLEQILASGETDVLLVLHHPMTWDIRHPEGAFIPIHVKHLPVLRERRIGVYVMHTPLDRNGPYSTTCSLARALGVEKTADCCEYFGVMVGVIGRTEYRTVQQLADRAAAAVGHRAKVWAYGDPLIADGRVALVAGGGNDATFHEEIAGHGIGTYVTGITALNAWSQRAHDIARTKRTNIIGLTHYSSEKFACMALCEYFAHLGLPCFFLGDEPVLADME